MVDPPVSDRPKYEGLAVIELIEGLLRGEVRAYLHFEENVLHVFSRLQYGQMWLTISTERFQLEGFHRENFVVF